MSGLEAKAGALFSRLIFWEEALDVLTDAQAGSGRVVQVWRSSSSRAIERALGIFAAWQPVRL